MLLVQRLHALLVIARAHKRPHAIHVPGLDREPIAAVGFDGKGMLLLLLSVAASDDRAANDLVPRELAVRVRPGEPSTCKGDPIAFARVARYIRRVAFIDQLLVGDTKPLIVLDEFLFRFSSFDISTQGGQLLG